MSKFTKFFCRIGEMFAFFGIVLLIVGFFMGGRPQGMSFGWNNGPVLNRRDIFSEHGTSRSQSTVTVPLINANTIQTLVVDIGMAEVDIRPGNEFSLDVTGDARYTSTVENGVWELSSESEYLNMTLFEGNTPRYTITVPADFSFASLSLNIALGTLQASGLHTQNAKLSVGAGSMKLSDFTADTNSILDVGMGDITVNGTMNGQIEIHCGMGNAKLMLARPTDYGYTASCGMGSVDIDGQRIDGIGGEINNNRDAATFYDIDCGMGTVKVAFSTAPTAPGASAVPPPPQLP